MSTQIISADQVNEIKAAAAAAADSAKAVAPTGTKMPVAQWIKRDKFETDGTKMLVELLGKGCVVSSIGKPTTSKAGEVGVNFKVTMPQVTLETKIQNYVTTQQNAKARRAAKRAAEGKGTKAKTEAKAEAAPAAAPAPAAQPDVAALLAQLQAQRKAA